MNRRRFLRNTFLGTAAVFLPRSGFAKPDSPEIAITMDDPRVEGFGPLSAEEANERILRHLAEAKLKAALFVCGMRVDNERGRKLLSAWNEAGHTLGNHTYSHKYFHGKQLTLSDFVTDAAKGEQVIAGYTRFRRLFRFPFFKEGDTVEKRDGMRVWLRKSGYRQGRATIDASDWAIDARLLERLKKNRDANLTPYRDFYLQHIWERAQYYDGLSRKVIGRSPKHTLLVHHNLLNAQFLGDLLAMFQAKGWRTIAAEDAYKDPVYRSEPQILPAGESLIWALAKATGNFDKELRYPGEDGDYENLRMDSLNL